MFVPFSPGAHSAGFLCPFVTALEVLGEMNVSTLMRMCVPLTLELWWTLQAAKERLVVEILLAGEPLGKRSGINRESRKLTRTILTQRVQHVASCLGYLQGHYRELTAQASERAGADRSDPQAVRDDEEDAREWSAVSLD